MDALEPVRGDVWMEVVEVGRLKMYDACVCLYACVHVSV